MAEENGEKSFDPTPHRREEFKKQGKFAKSRDAGPVVVTAAVLAVLLGSRDAIGQAIHMLFLRCHGDLGALGRQDAGGVVQAAFGVFTVAAAPAMVAACLAGGAMSIVQSGGRMNDKFGFDPTRLNPLPGFMKLFSPMQGSKEAALNLLRVGVVGYVAYSALMREVPNLMVMSRGDLHAGTHGIIEAAVHVMTNALGALGLVAGIDYAQSRFSLEKEMKMTRKEIMDETKQQDGDPKIKMRMRQRARGDGQAPRHEQREVGDGDHRQSDAHLDCPPLFEDRSGADRGGQRARRPGDANPRRSAKTRNPDLGKPPPRPRARRRGPDRPSRPRRPLRRRRPHPGLRLQDQRQKALSALRRRGTRRA